MPRWNEVDDALLAKLFKAKTLDPTKLNTKDIREALKHFPDKQYASFAVTYKKKCRKWCLEQTLAGKRRGPNSSEKRKTPSEEEQPSAAAEDLFDEENDKDYTPEEEEYSGDEEVIKEEATTTTKRAPKPVADTSDLLDKMAKMTVSSKAMDFDMSIKCPFIMYEYTTDGRDLVSVDFLIPAVHRRFIRVKVAPCGTILELSIVIPGVFYDPYRLLCANAEEQDFNTNTHKATAFEKTAEKIQETANDVDEVIGSSPQRVKLPFKVETDFYKPTHEDCDDEGWEVQLFENDDQELIQELEGPSDFFILSVDMVSVKKKKAKKTRGKMRKVKKTEYDEDASAEDGNGDANMS